MTRRRMMLTFLMYVTLDLSNPFVPGAFNFDPDKCVEGIHRASSPQERADVSPPPGRALMGGLAPLPRSAARPVARGRHAVLEWLIDSREDARASGDPPPSGEDH